MMPANIASFAMGGAAVIGGIGLYKAWLKYNASSEPVTLFYYFDKKFSGRAEGPMLLLEDAGVPYCYVPSKEELGAAGQTKRPTSCMLLLPGPAKGKGEDADGKYKEAYDEVRKKVKAIAPTF